MLTRLALVAPSGQSQQRLRTLLSRPLVYNVREFHTMPEVQAGLATFSFQVLILRIPQITTDFVHTVQKLRAAFPTAGLVSVSPAIDPQVRFLLRNVDRHSIVDEELELDDLDQLIAKTAKPKSTNWSRMHPRAQRDDMAMLVTTEPKYEDTILFEAKFANFSRMGARLVVHAPEKALGLAVKSRVELRYHSSEDPKHVHRLEARVAWIKKTSPLETVLAGSSKTTLGLRFVAEL